MFSRLFFSLAFFLLFATLPTAAAKRVALVIGNNAYSNLAPERQLMKAVNDAKAVRDTLESDLGFTVLYDEDADWARMNALMKQLEASIDDGDVVFFYFSGHGVSISGENFLLPSDIPTPRQGEESRLMGNSFGAEALTRRIQRRGARAIFVVLDACRDNPFVDEGGKGIGGDGGLTVIDAADGVFTLFAAGLGQKALDRLSDNDLNPNSIFTRNLIPLLKTAGLSQIDLAKKLQKDVEALAATVGHKQKPAFIDQISGFVTLKSGGPAPADQPLSREERARLPAIAADFKLAKDIDTADAWAAFLKEHGDQTGSFYVGLAKAAKQKLALNVPTTEPDEMDQIDCQGIFFQVSIDKDWRCLSPGDEFSDCNFCPAMVVVPAGSFLMGSPASEKGREKDEGPQRKVEIRQAFAVGKFEITFAEWDSCVKTGGCNTHQPEDEGWGRGSRPVIHVNWQDAQAYVQWLSKGSGVTYRLLSESEWEYAARAGTKTPYSTGSTITTKQANFNRTLERTAKAGSFKGNNYGLYDMHGNVGEWVNDCYYDREGASLDLSDLYPELCKFRVVRGGDWTAHSLEMRLADRTGLFPGFRSEAIGFRVARTLP